MRLHSSLRHTLVALLVAAACAPPLTPVAAQPAPTLSDLRSSIDSTRADLRRYCKTSKPLAYLCPIDTLRLAHVSSAIQIPPPTSIVDVSYHRYVSGSQTPGAMLVQLPPFVWWTATIPDAQWIWKSAAVADPTIADSASFTLSIPGAPTAPMTIALAADNGYAISVNNHLIVDSLSLTGTAPFASVASYTVPSTALIAGTNRVVLSVRNAAAPTATSPDQNPAGLLYAITVGSSTNCLTTDSIAQAFFGGVRDTTVNPALYPAPCGGGGLSSSTSSTARRAAARQAAARSSIALPVKKP